LAWKNSLIFFAAQSNIDDCNGTPPNEIQSLIENLEYIVLNEEEVENVLINIFMFFFRLSH
jgi:hypothetical protein